MIHFDVLENYGFVQMWRPSWILAMIAVAVLYFYLLGPLRHKFADSRPLGAGRKISFLSGLLLTYLMLGSPLNLIGLELLFSMHMMQQSIMFFIVPPLILMGIPAWMIRPLLAHARVKKTVEILTKPSVSIVLFNFTLSFYHFPMIFDYMAEHPLGMELYHTVIEITAFAMWWNVTCPVPEMEKMSGLIKVIYLVVNGLLLYPACALIIFADRVVYDAYANAPLFVTLLPPLEDQSTGGVVMKLMQEGMIGVGITFVFYRWARKVRANEPSLDPISADRVAPAMPKAK